MGRAACQADFPIARGEILVRDDLSKAAERGKVTGAAARRLTQAGGNYQQVMEGRRRMERGYE
jgi:hypothetical protein